MRNQLKRMLVACCLTLPILASSCGDPKKMSESDLRRVVDKRIGDIAKTVSLRKTNGRWDGRYYLVEFDYEFECRGDGYAVLGPSVVITCNAGTFGKRLQGHTWLGVSWTEQGWE